VTVARKLILAVGGGSLLVYVAVVVIVVRMGRLTSLELLGRFAEDFVASRAVQVDGFLRSPEAVARSLAATVPLGEGAARPIERALCGALVAPIEGARLVLEPNAPSLASGPRGWTCALEGQAPQFAALPVGADSLSREARPEGSWARLPSAASGQPGALVYSLRVLEGKGEASRPRATVQVEVPLAALHSLVESLRPARGTAFLVTDGGDAIAPPAMAPAEFGASPELEGLLARLKAELGDRGHYQGPIPGQGGSSWIGYRRIPSSGWWLVAAVPQSTLLRDLNALRLQLMALMLVGAAVLLVGTALLARSITRPITLLAGAARRIADGDLETAAPVTTSTDEVGALARSFDEMRVSLRHHIAEVERHAATRAQMERDLKIAQEIQSGLLPTDFAAITRGHRADLFALVVPARHVGGDLYDVFRIDERRACLVLGDVSGKGLPAALFMTAARTLFRALTQPGLHPAEILARVNEALAAENPRSMFVTACCAVLDLTDGRLAFANAGHLPAAIATRSGPSRFAPEVAGLPLGLMPGAQYDPSEIVLAPGDTILLYTDGVTEALDTAQVLFEAERLLARLDAGPHETARQTVEDVLSGVRSFAGEAPQSDDIGLLALRWDGPATSA
jgi:sigma-B regulation protein RsbU (phosphoserine phosphatase)